MVTDKDFMSSLSKNERHLLRYITVYKLFGMILVAIGIGGIALGWYSIKFRPMDEDARQLIHTLIGYSVGFIMFGWLFSSLCRMVQKFRSFCERL